MELFYFCGFIASAVVGGLLGRHFGALGGWIGAGLGLIFWGGGLRGINILIERSLALPICRHGKCKISNIFRDHGNYRLLKKKNGVREFQCKCGDKYILKENRFMAVNEKGVAQPYMKRRHSFAKWEKDDSQGVQ